MKKKKMECETTGTRNRSSNGRMEWSEKRRRETVKKWAEEKRISAKRKSEWERNVADWKRTEQRRMERCRTQRSDEMHWKTKVVETKVKMCVSAKYMKKQGNVENIENTWKSKTWK